MEANILDKINLVQLGEDLQQARKRAGIKQEDAAKIIEVARTTIVAIEKGERRIKASELLKLARAYGRPPTDFVGNRPSIKPFEVQFRGPLFRTNEDEKAIQPYIYELEDLCRNYLELEQIMESPLQRNYPTEYSVRNLSLEQAAENIALEERHRLKLGDVGIQNLRNILEQLVGLRIFLIKLPSQFSEMYCYSEQTGGCLALNQNHPHERRQWSLAYGYAHFLTSRYKPFFHQEGEYQRIPESEKFADLFAMYFLMPTNSLIRCYNEIQNPTLGDLLSLAHQYSVSLSAMTLRLEGLKLIKVGTAELIKRDGFAVNEGKKQLGLEPIPANEERLPTRYLYLALDALQQEKIGEEQFARFLNVDRIEARKIANSLRQPTLSFSLEAESESIHSSKDSRVLAKV